MTTNTSDIRRGRHCVFDLHVHLVFITKYRKTIFSKEHIQCLKNIFREVCQDFQADLIECQGEQDHIHLLINYPNKVAISKLVNSLKSVSSCMLRQKHPNILQYYWKNVLWSPSYFASSCGEAPINIVRKYIEEQQQPK